MKNDSPPKRVTLLDVAKDAGISRATASLVVRGSSRVAEETREKVLASIDKLGYVYNRAAASLRTQRSQTIGLIVTDITNPFFAQMTVASEVRFEEDDYAVLLANTSEKSTKQDRILETMVAHGVDGVLLCPARGTTTETLASLRRWHLPFVLVARYLYDNGAHTAADYVGADNVLGAQMAAAHLVQLGHHRIAFIGGPVDSSARRDRMQGYLSALEQYGLSYDTALSISSPVTREGGYAAVLALLSSADPPTAALCYNDVVAFGVMLGLQAAGRAPGVDFAVVGFDDIDEAALWRPALTTVAISPKDIGAKAAKLLLERIAAPEDAPRQVILPPSLVIRESCGGS